MNKYIIELLKLESTVIIPNFGALMKSGKSLIFNSILKYNDQKLEKFIAEKENMELQDVSNALAKYVREIVSIIEKGDEFLIVGIGSFYKAENGKVALKMEENFTEEKDSEEIKVNTPKKETVVTSLYKDKPVKKEELNTPTENDLIKSVSTKKETPKEVKPILKEEPKQQPVIIKEIKKPEVKPKVTKPKKEKKKKKGLVWLLLLLLILAGGGTYIGLNLEKVKNLIGLNKQTENQELNSSVDEENIDTESMNEVDPEEELMLVDSTENYDDTAYLEEDFIDTEKEVVDEIEHIEIEKPVNTNKELIYHVIVGAFGSEENAKGLVDKLKKDGFNTAKIVGKHGSLHKVAASCHATQQEANDAIEKAKSINKDAFVEKKK